MGDARLSNSTPIHGVAVDQGSGLAKALREVRGGNALEGDLLDFKRIVVEGLSVLATTLLVDATYGPDLLPRFDQNCIPMLAYEADVYRITDADRITVLPDRLRISDYGKLGVRYLKFFLYFAPRDSDEVNQRKFDLVRSIGNQCSQEGVAFLFEPIVYDPVVIDTTSREFALLKPALVAEATRSFADPGFKIDYLKVEIPVNFDYVEGYGEGVMTTAEAHEAFRHAAASAGTIPILYLSAGVTFERFEAALTMARMADVRPAGFMCGRAIWSDAIAVYGAQGPAGAERWIAREGCVRLSRLAEVLA